MLGRLAKFVVQTVGPSVVVDGLRKGADAVMSGLNPAVKIAVRGGELEIVAGRLTSSAQRVIKTALQDLGVQSCTIRVFDNGKIRFSSEVPENGHQRLVQ
jgi:hypothetical protein